MEIREWIEDDEDEQALLRIRFWLVVVAGGLASVFGILANALLTRLFLSRLAFRHSPFFFLGFVALFDTLLDAVYILLLQTEKTSTKRRVEFVKQPTIFEITPLTSKAPGVTRMPTPTKGFDEFESPVMEAKEKEDEEESLDLALPPEPDEVVYDSTEEMCGQEQPVAGTSNYEAKSRRTKVFRKKAIDPPKMDLSDSDGNEEKSSSAISGNGNLTKNGNPQMDAMSLLDVKELNAFKKGQTMKCKGTSQLWSTLFAAQDQEDIFDLTSYFELTEWLDKWRDRLQKQANEENKNEKKGSKKRRREFEEEEEEEEDADFDASAGGEQLANPMILAGPTSCGKTTMAYFAAKTKGFHVIEIPIFEKRDKQSLEQKLAGALENHNVGKGRSHPDIRDIFAQNRNFPTLKRKSTTDFTLLLVDECDLNYSVDSHFWSTLKSYCTNSQVPIIFTCNDNSIVRNELLGREPVVENYKFIHIKTPSKQIFITYLRNWLMGFDGRLKLAHLTINNLFEQKCGDMRAILNALQFRQRTQIVSSNSDDHQELAISLKEITRQAKQNSLIDSLCGTTALSWRVKMLPDLDYAGGAMTIEDEGPNVEEMVEFRTDMMVLLNFDDSIHPHVKPIEAVKCACLLRNSDRIYSTREATLDQLPCLMLIDKCFARSNQRQQHSRRQLHPFDAVDPDIGTMIDNSQDLKHLVWEYGNFR